eukprot:1087258-Prorocentrum_lima.AAC.1
MRHAPDWLLGLLRVLRLRPPAPGSLCGRSHNPRQFGVRHAHPAAARLAGPDDGPPPPPPPQPPAP